MSPKASQNMDELARRLAKVRFSLYLRADNTFVMTTPPLYFGRQTSEGTWKIAGHSVRLIVTKQNGRSPSLGQNLPGELTVSEDGKTMTSAGRSSPIAVVFTRSGKRGKGWPQYPHGGATSVYASNHKVVTVYRDGTIQIYNPADKSTKTYPPPAVKVWIIKIF